MDGEEAQMRNALREIERLLEEASESGVPVERWIEQFVDELRAAFPESPGPDHAEVASRIQSDPGQSISAQARIDPELVRALKTRIVSG